MRCKDSAFRRIRKVARAHYLALHIYSAVKGGRDSVDLPPFTAGGIVFRWRSEGCGAGWRDEGGGAVPTLGLGGLGAELGLDLGDAGTKLCLVLDAPLDGLHPVHDRGVVTAVEELGDGLVGSVGMLLH